MYTAAVAAAAAPRPHSPCLVLEQELDNVAEPPRGRYVQWRQIVPIPPVQVSSSIDVLLDLVLPVVRYCLVDVDRPSPPTRLVRL